MGTDRSRDFSVIARTRSFNRFSSDLGTLHSSRIAADYRLADQRAENANNVKSFVHHAKKIIDTLERCCTGPNRHAIIKAIRDHNKLETGTAQEE